MEGFKTEEGPMKGLEQMNGHMARVTQEVNKRLDREELKEVEDVPLAVTKLLVDLSSESRENLVAICYIAQRKVTSVLANAMMKMTGMMDLPEEILDTIPPEIRKEYDKMRAGSPSV